MSEIDIIIDSPISYSKANKNANIIKIEKYKIKVISIDDLIKMKKASQRDKDKIDLISRFIELVSQGGS